MLLLMLCTFSKGLFLNSRTFFKGLFALFCHFFKGLSVAKIQNFLLKGKENGNYFFFKRKVFPFSHPAYLLVRSCLPTRWRRIHRISDGGKPRSHDQYHEL